MRRNWRLTLKDDCARPATEPVQRRERQPETCSEVQRKGPGGVYPAVLLWTWYRMYRPVRTATAPVRSSRKNVRTATEPAILPARRRSQVSIPAGIDNGQSIRIRDKGEPGVNGGPRGDLLVEVVVSRHPVFQRQDMNIFSTVPISFAQAALGGELRSIPWTAL